MVKLEAVSGALVRGTTYHFNIPIPAGIQHLYGGKAAFRGTMKTSDPKAAAGKVTTQRAIFIEQAAQVQREAEMARLAELLTEGQRSKLNAIGGADALPKHVADLRKAVALLTAGLGSEINPDEEGADTALAEMQRREDAAAERGRIEAIIAETRESKRMASALSVELPPPPKGIDEGVIGLHDVADKFMTSKQYTVHNREKVLYTLRRWTELHGDLALDKITRAHLNEFDEALKGLPPAVGDHRKLSFRQSVQRATKDGKAPIRDKTRATYLLHMKSLTAYAVDRLGAMSADPFAGYTTDKTKQKASAAKEQKTVPYTAAQVRAIIDHSRETFAPETLDHWIPMLAAYLGARQEELIQLTVDDVVLIGNHWCIRITDMDPAQKVKNQHSLRTLPVPPVLVEAGFLEYADRRRQAGAKMLWQESFTGKRKKATLQDVRPDGRGRFATNYGHRFREKVRKPLDLTEPGMKFHSLRHSWADAARRAKLDTEIRRMIAGRLEDADPVEADYGGDDLLAEKLEALIAVGDYVVTS